MAALEVLALDEATPQIRAPGSGDTYLAPRKLAITPEANDNALAVTGYSLTGANAQSLVDLAGTWNTTGTPTAIKLDITDTASNAASLLMDLQLGGASAFSVSKTNGDINQDQGGGAVAQAKLKVAGATWASIFQGSGWGGGRSVRLGMAGFPIFAVGTYIALSSDDDTKIYRDAANIFAQRNGTNAQEQRTYGTFTDASNHRRLVMKMSAAGVAEIHAEGAGTGASGNVLHISSLPTSNPGPGILWNNSGTPAIGT